MPRVAERMTEKRLRSLTKGCSCGVVPGLEVRVRTLGDGSIRCHTNFRHPFNLSWSGKTCDIRRSSKTTS